MSAPKTVENGTGKGATGMIVAAYLLGRESRIVGYRVSYQRAYRHTPETEHGAQLRDGEAWMRDALAGLSSAGLDPMATTRLRQHLDLLRKQFEVASAGQIDVWGNDFVLSCRRTSVLAYQCMRQSLPLYPWYKLGAAVGRCILRLFYDDRATPGLLRTLTRAAAAVSPQRVERVPQLKRLAAAHKVQGELAIEVVCQCLGRPLSGFETGECTEKVALVWAMRQLDKELQVALAAEPDPAILSFKSTQVSDVVAIGGEGYAVSDAQMAIVQELYRLQGQRVSRSVLRKRFSVLAKANINRLLREMPPALRLHVGSDKGRHGGHFWVDPIPT